MKKTLMTVVALLGLMSAKAQLVNLDLEQWDSTSSGAIYPHGWPELAYWIHQQVPDAHSGNYALQVNVWYYYTETKAVQAMPCNYRPYAFAGFYKYTDNEIKNQITNLVTEDTAWAAVYVTKWNTATMHTDTIGNGRVDLMRSTAYSNFVCPVTYFTSDMPDSVTIVCDPSMMRDGGMYFSTASDGKNSFLTIDDLYLQRWPSAINSVSEMQFSVTPNPAHDQINIAMPVAGTYNIVVTDISGRIMNSMQLINGAEKVITLDGYPAGMYNIAITNMANKEQAVKTIVRQ